jgi:hypothetical protein
MKRDLAPNAHRLLFELGDADLRAGRPVRAEVARACAELRALISAVRAAASAELGRAGHVIAGDRRSHEQWMRRVKRMHAALVRADKLAGAKYPEAR